MLNLFVPETVAQTDIVDLQGMNPLSLPGSASIPTVVDAVPPMHHLILSVFVDGASKTNPTAVDGADAEEAVVAVSEVLTIVPLVLIGPITVTVLLVV